MRARLPPLRDPRYICLMSETTASVLSHYAATDLLDRILRALREAGHDTAHPSVTMFNLVDQLHGGGLNATKAQAEWAGVKKAMRVLDAGCGIGGSSRYLAQTYGCKIDAIDLTPDFVATAKQINALCGLADAIAVREGSVTELPYADASFDLVWSQNVTMNIADKPRMFAECYRVLRPGGRFTVSHAARGPNGEPYYPLPWASEPSYSFLGTPDEFVQMVRAAGFVKIESRTEGGTPGDAGGRPAGDIGPGVVMGGDTSIRVANARRSGADGRLIGLVVVAEKAA
jgi:sarcosine/dimethylglycine N-methyltransferase